MQDLLLRLIDNAHKSKVHSVGLLKMETVLSNLDSWQKKIVPECLHAMRNVSLAQSVDKPCEAEKTQCDEK